MRVLTAAFLAAAAAALAAGTAGAARRAPDQVQIEFKLFAKETPGVVFVLDRKEGAAPVLYVDANGDGDLTNDAAVTLSGQQQQNADGSIVVVVYRGKADVTARYEGTPAQPLSLSVYRIEYKKGQDP